MGTHRVNVWGTHKSGLLLPSRELQRAYSDADYERWINKRRAPFQAPFVRPLLFAPTATLLGSNSTPAHPLAISITSPAAGDTILIGVVTDFTPAGTFSATGFSLVSKVASNGGDLQDHVVMIKNSASGSETSISISNTDGDAMIGWAIGVSGLDATTKQDRAADGKNDNAGTGASPWVIDGTALAPATSGCLLVSSLGADPNASNNTVTTFSSLSNLTSVSKLADLNSGFYNIAVGIGTWNGSGNAQMRASTTFTAGNVDGSLITTFLRPASGAAARVVKYAGTWNGYAGRSGGFAG